MDSWEQISSWLPLLSSERARYLGRHVTEREFWQFLKDDQYSVQDIGSGRMQEHIFTPFGLVLWVNERNQRTSPVSVFSL